MSSKQEFINHARPLAESLVEYAMAHAERFGITDVKVTIVTSEDQENSVEKGAVIRSVSGASHQVTVTLYAGDHTLSFTKNTFDEKSLKSAMFDNMSVILKVPANKDKRLLEKEKVYKGRAADLDQYDATSVDQETMINYAKDMEAAAMAEPGIKGIRSVGIMKNDRHILVLATNGIDIQESTTLYAASAAIVAEDANGRQIDYQSSVARHFCDMSKPKDLGQHAAKGALSKLSPSLPQTGEMPIVLSQDAAASFFGAVTRAIQGTQIHRGTSMFKDKLGEQVMNKDITIVDDPTIARAYASGTVDAAGVEAKSVTLVENGVLKSYLVNLQEARQLGIEPMGRESGMTNTMVLPGTATPQELIADIKEGIYIQSWDGGEANINNGSHSREAYGVMIKDGKLTDERVAGFIITGNLKDMFMNAVIANDTPKLPDSQRSFAAPTTKITGVTVAGK